MTTTLYGAAATGVTLPEALEQARLDAACALLTTPSAYRVARVEGGECRTTGGAVDLSVVYEARVFTSVAELRWVEAGYAVLLTENRSRLPGAFTEPVDELSALAVLKARYLVWGEAAEPVVPGWTRLASNRVGTLSVPMTAPPWTGRVRLAALEYVVADEQHGNAYVAEERLIGFEPYTVEGVAS